MIFPNYLIGFVMIAIGMAGAIFMRPLAEIVSIFTGHTQIIAELSHSMNNISLLSGIFIALIGLLWLARAWQQRKHRSRTGTTWGCGYSGAKPAVHQYTATSYAESLSQLAPRVVNVKKLQTEIQKEEIFPAEHDFKTHSSDIFENVIIEKPFRKLKKWLERIAVFQTGKIQHYLLYALIFVIIIFLLTLANWI